MDRRGLRGKVLGRTRRADRPVGRTDGVGGGAPPAGVPAIPRPSPPAHGRGRGRSRTPRRPGGGRVRIPRCRHSRLHRQRPCGRTRRVVTWPVRRGRVAGPSVAAGVLLALSLPPWGWWPLGLAGAGLLYWRLAAQPLWRRLWCGWLAGLGCYVIGLAWARTFNWYGALALIVVEALFVAAAAVLTPPDRGRALAFVGACTLTEAVRVTWPFGGLPLGGVFLGQAGGPLLQLARLGGPLLVTAGVWAGGVAAATAVAWVRATLRMQRRPALGGA